MSKHSEGFLKMVDAAKKQIKEISPAETLKKVQSKNRDQSLYFVDCREDSEWNEGRAQGAIHIGKGVLERDIETKIPDKGAEIIIYCGGGFRSALAAESLQRMGYKNVFSMSGGIREWREKGFPEEGRA